MPLEDFDFYIDDDSEKEDENTADQ